LDGVQLYRIASLLSSFFALNVNENKECSSVPKFNLPNFGFLLEKSSGITYKKEQISTWLGAGKGCLQHG
jgi:hypothetical protein